MVIKELLYERLPSIECALKLFFVIVLAFIVTSEWSQPLKYVLPSYTLCGSSVTRQLL